MRTRLVVLLSLAACSSPGDTMGGDDQPPGPDAGTIDPPARGFQIVTPEIDVMPNQEITYCYYFRTPNNEPLAIKKWESAMTPGSHHMIMFTTTNTSGQPVDKMPPGTVSASNCGFGTTNPISTWTFATQTPTSVLDLPADDGAGKPVAQEIVANAAAFFQMHYFNASDQPLKAKVTLNAYALDAGVAYTKTAAYVTYNANISIPPQTTGDVETQTCSTPAGAKFWLMSTHAHKQAVLTQVKDGTSMAVESTDWEHPKVERWMTSPFFGFATNKLTYACTYNNPTNRTISSGDSADTDEMCMASGYFFPATKPVFCINSTVVPF